MPQIHKKNKDCRPISLRPYIELCCNRWFLIVSIGFLIFVSTLIVHNVSGKITPQDEVALKKILKSLELEEDRTFQDEINFIINVQDAVLNVSEPFIKIPLNHTREPQDLVSLGHGQCGDRARTIEKALRLHGFEVRVAAAFSRDKTYLPKDALKYVSDSDLLSHALTEVKTSKGWMIVDTNERWISLDTDNNPVSIDTWKNIKDKERFKWTKRNVGNIYWLLKGDFVVVYGLYSRHGRFYPPYTPYIPDINVQSMIRGHLF